MSRAVLTLVNYFGCLALAASLACSPEAPQERTVEEAEPAQPAVQTVDTAPEPGEPIRPEAAATAPPAAAPPAAPQRADSPLVGTWRLQPAVTPRPGAPGIRMTLVIDSVRADRLFGRLRHYFAGNMGIDPSQFRPFEGGVSDGEVTIRIEHADPAGPGLLFAGRVAGDTVRLATFAIGPDSLSRDAAWILVKGR